MKFKKISRIAAFLAIALILSLSSFAQTSVKLEPESISKRVKLGNFVEIPIKVINDGNTLISLRFAVEGSVAKFSSLDKTSANIEQEILNR